jgi:hypothetical protein
MRKVRRDEVEGRKVWGRKVLKRRLTRRAALAALLAAGWLAAGAGAQHGAVADVDAAELTAAYLAGAPYQDLSATQAAGYVSTLTTLGCFHDAARGGMGLHYLREDLLDAQLDAAQPEALVYELDTLGNVAGLVAHEYIVPVDAWTSDQPPTVLGQPLHRHPVLPLWVLHAWLWKDNPSGFFADYNPAVRLCPAGVPVFGQDQ